MNIEALRECCIAVKGSSESCPFLDNTVLVFKVMGKMFAYIALEPKDGIFKVCLKCNPEKSTMLREQYHGITETDFKTWLWNTVYLESDVPDPLIKDLIHHSVDEVVKKLPKGKQQEYLNVP